MRSTLIVVSALLCLACENGTEILFQGPLPENGSVYTAIPAKLTGRYLSLKDSTELIIAKDQIVRVIALRYATEITQLDSAERAMIKGDTSFSLTEEGLELNVFIKGDSVFESAHYADTIFRFAEGDVFRKYKGYYFLNEKTTADLWRVTKLRKIKRGIVLSVVSKEKELDKLRELTNTDSTHIFKLTDEQFRKFLNEGGLQQEEIFIKM